MKTLTFKLDGTPYTQEIPYDARPRKISAFSISSGIKIISSAPGKLVDPGTPKSTTTLLFDFCVIGNEDMTGLTTYTEGVSDVSLTADTEAEESEIKAQEQAEAKAQARELLIERMSKSAAQTEELTIPEYALMARAQMYDEWQAEQSYAQGKRITYNGIVYEVQQATTSSSVYPPDGEGVLALYAPLSTDGSGTLEDSYVWIYGMHLETGEYVVYNNTVYKAKSPMKPCTWTPGSDANVWETVSTEE